MSQFNIKTRLDFILTSKLTSEHVSDFISFFLDHCKEKRYFENDELKALFLDYSHDNMKKIIASLRAVIQLRTSDGKVRFKLENEVVEHSAHKMKILLGVLNHHNSTLKIS